MLPAGCPPDPGNGALANGYDLLRGHCVGVAVSEKSVSYDVHTLAKAIATTEQITRVSVPAAFVDKGYRGNDDKGSATIHISGSSSRRLTRTQKKRRKRRSAVEKIGHLKTDNRMGRCFLKGLIGDSINAVLAAAGSNLQKLLRAIAHAPPFWLWSRATGLQMARFGPFYHSLTAS